MVNLVDRFTINQLLAIGIVVRGLLVLYSIFHDYYFRVKYTDIDYGIVVDGAREMLHGGTPFDRTTYRYTPLLAALVIPSVVIANPFGKIVFTLCDVGAARYAYKVLVSFATERSAKQLISVFILFNPIVLNVSTRGNSDMLITFMSMFVLSKFFEGKYFTAASMLGFAIHFKIYPIIYALPLVLGVWEHAKGTSAVSRAVHALPTVLGCGVLCVLFFAVPTFLCYLLYGQQYLDEAFLYHVHREDHRHNFSPYWLLMYLNMGRRALGVAGEDYSAGLFAFIPQCVVLFYVSWRLRRNIAHACCVQTVMFIAYNKVCTVQYFVWFLPFLPFVFCELKGKQGSSAAAEGRMRKVQPSLVEIVLVMLAWSSTIPLWVFTAYPLEFEGENHFGRLWLVSCIFFVATVGLGAWLGRVCRRVQEANAELQRNKIE